MLIVDNISRQIWTTTTKHIKFTYSAETGIFTKSGSVTSSLQFPHSVSAIKTYTFNNTQWTSRSQIHQLNTTPCCCVANQFAVCCNAATGICYDSWTRQVGECWMLFSCWCTFLFDVFSFISHLVSHSSSTLVLFMSHLMNNNLLFWISRLLLFYSMISPPHRILFHSHSSFSSFHSLSRFFTFWFPHIWLILVD